MTLVDLISDPAVNLFAPLSNSGGHEHTILRETNIVAAHNAYHAGELGILREVMGLWPQPEQNPQTAGLW